MPRVDELSIPVQNEICARGEGWGKGIDTQLTIDVGKPN
jgi:hypothetical protein